MHSMSSGQPLPSSVFKNWVITVRIDTWDVTKVLLWRTGIHTSCWKYQKVAGWNPTSPGLGRNLLARWHAKRHQGWCVRACPLRRRLLYADATLIGGSTEWGQRVSSWHVHFRSKVTGGCDRASIPDERGRETNRNNEVCSCEIIHFPTTFRKGSELVLSRSDSFGLFTVSIECGVTEKLNLNGKITKIGIVCRRKSASVELYWNCLLSCIEILFPPHIFRISVAAAPHAWCHLNFMKTFLFNSNSMFPAFIVKSTKTLLGNAAPLHAHANGPMFQSGDFQ